MDTKGWLYKARVKVFSEYDKHSKANHPTIDLKFKVDECTEAEKCVVTFRSQ